MSIDVVLKFIQEHYRLIIDLVALLVAFIVLIARKKPVNSIAAAIYSSALVAVNAAEQTALKGSDKLDYAISIVREDLLKQFPKLDVNRYVSLITFVIEAILDCPQKK